MNKNEQLPSGDKFGKLSGIRGFNEKSQSKQAFEEYHVRDSNP